MKALRAISDRILSWYGRHKRDLPWRKTRNPYFIWVSEVMLQQTQVDTVIPYYHRFLKQFPTIEALAKASLQEVLKAWENMGYYARARHLHAAAGEVVNRMGGKIPQTWDELIRLPGIGSYTASAILSFAFGKTFPTVDGNAQRVLCRLHAIQEPIDQSSTQKKVYELAARMIPSKDPASFNHGIMELGATICKPRSPLCNTCPVADLCLAIQKGLQEVLPIMRERKPLRHKEMTAAVIGDKRGRLLIVQRPNRGLLGGLWKFPGGERGPDETLQQGLRRRVREELGIGIRVGEAFASVDHAYTHFRITLHAFRCARRNGRPRAIDCHKVQWVKPDRLDDFPFSRADRKVIEALWERNI
ncbi:MAG: A/G-specific adenine glycosylase [Deltaproteobacteria bacterium]|nr:MAG: A/G-specific adenine glycosylase [Deltaproteobacteria bacterium]